MTIVPMMNMNQMIKIQNHDSLANKLAEQILREKLKERGINIPNNCVVKNKTSQTIKPACKLQIIQPRGLTDFLPGLFSDNSSLAVAAVNCRAQLI